MADLADELRQRLEQQPDKWTLAWWRSQLEELKAGYRGASHGVNRALADYEETAKLIDELRERVQALEADRQADRAKIGEMAARLDRIAEFMNEVKKGVKPQKGT